MGLGDNIKKYRELRNMSVPALAKKMGIGKTGVYKWEDGSTVPGTENLTAIAEALGVTVNDLIGENNTSVQKEAAVAESWEASAFKKIIEGGAEYVLVPRHAFDGNHRFTSVEQIDIQARELEYKAKEIEQRAKEAAAKDDEIRNLTKAFMELVSKIHGLGSLPELPKVQETKKDTPV